MASQGHGGARDGDTPAGAGTRILVSAISRRDALFWHNVVESILRSAMPSTTTVALVGLMKSPCGKSQTSKNRSLRQPAAQAF